MLPQGAEALPLLRCIIDRSTNSTFGEFANHKRVTCYFGESSIFLGVSMSGRNVAKAFLFALCLAASRSLSAMVIFHVGPGAIAPNENLLFNLPGLTATGTVIEGATNQSGTVFEILSNDNPLETLNTPANGQARVTSQDGAFASIILLPRTLNTFFDKLEFNVNVKNRMSGLFTLSVVDQFNNTFIDNFIPNALGQGQNFFSVESTSGTLLKKATLTANGQIIEDIRQIRLGGIVPEPSSYNLAWLLLPLALLPMRQRS